MTDRDPTPRTHETSELERAVQRALAVRALDAVSEVLDTEVRVSELIRTIDDAGASPTKRLIAKRALRCAGSVASEPKVIKAIGDQGVYPYAEGVVLYGASNDRYLSLMRSYNLTAEEATGLYALRELIAEHANDNRPSFQQIFEALKQTSISIHEAANDPYGTVAAFDEAGYFTDHSAKKQFNSTIFFPPLGETSVRLVEDDGDGSISQGINEGLREELRRPPEEIEEGDVWQQDVEEFLKNLDS